MIFREIYRLTLHCLVFYSILSPQYNKMLDDVLRGGQRVQQSKTFAQIWIRLSPMRVRESNNILYLMLRLRSVIISLNGIYYIILWFSTMYDIYGEIFITFMVSHFITFMVDVYYIYGCYYIYG